MFKIKKHENINKIFVFLFILFKQILSFSGFISPHKRDGMNINVAKIPAPITGSIIKLFMKFPGVEYMPSFTPLTLNRFTRKLHAFARYIDKKFAQVNPVVSTKRELFLIKL